jgi:uncharacterized protein
MRRLLATQWFAPFSLGHHDSGTLGQSGVAQSGEATAEGSFPAEPTDPPRGMGRAGEPPCRGGDGPVPHSRAGIVAPISGPTSAHIPQRGRAEVKTIGLALIRFYQLCLSPALPSSCRYYPSCSAYTYEAVARWGLWQGTRMAIGRLLRCRPWGGHGYDPVP